MTTSSSSSSSVRPAISIFLGSDDERWTGLDAEELPPKTGAARPIDDCPPGRSALWPGSRVAAPAVDVCGFDVTVATPPQGCVHRRDSSTPCHCCVFVGWRTPQAMQRPGGEGCGDTANTTTNDRVCPAYVPRRPRVQYNRLPGASCKQACAASTAGC